MNKSILIILVVLLRLANLPGQDAREINKPATIIPPSPDAASLGIYGNIPVSKYTGVPDISIPLYDINFRDVQVPMNLSYHSAGVNVEQDASWVGLGWALNVGGVITRTVKGGDDMQFADDGYSRLVNYGYMGYPYDKSESDGNFLHDVCAKNTDAEPDIFYFNFLGKSGSFMLGKGQNVADNFLYATAVNSEKIEIKYDKINHQWIIRTSDGYSYYFSTVEVSETLTGRGSSGKGPKDTQFSAQNGLQSWDDVVVTGWYLDKMISPLGEEVIYIYDTIDQLYNGVPTGAKISKYGSARISVTDANNTVIIPQYLNQCTNPVPFISATKTFSKHVYLKEVQFSGGKIIFSKSLRDDMLPSYPVAGSYSYLFTPTVYLSNNEFGPQKLDNITVLNSSNQVIRKFDLVYDYFNSHVTGIEKYDFKRLRLDKIRECGVQECKPYYQLFYNETHSLPSKYSNAQDFWGYYNGAENNISKIPYGTYLDPGSNTYFNLGDSDRQPNASYISTGVLTKIIFPTGGSTEFEFEPHDYFSFGNEVLKLTDFENNFPVGIAEARATAENGPYTTVTFTLTEPIQEVSLSEEMLYFASATTSDPCNVVDPGSIYVGTEIWYSLRNVSSPTPIVSHNMSDFLNFFILNWNTNCKNSPYTPDAIDPIYRKKQTVVLNAGTYELKVFGLQGFNNDVIVSTRHIAQRVIKKNVSGVLAKTAGGLRIKRITSKADEYSTPLIKNYDYTVINPNGERQSTGQLMLFPNYHFPNYCWGGPFPNLFSIVGRCWTNTPLGTSASGSIVGYDRVTESDEDYSAGSVVYNYINQYEDDDNQSFIEGLPTKKNSSNGLIKSVQYLNKDGGTVKEEIYDYSRQLSQEFVGVIIKMNSVLRQPDLSNPECLPYYFDSRSYTVPVGRWVLSKKTEETLASNTNAKMTKVIDYDYDTETHLQLKTETTTTKEGDVFVSNYIYPSQASWIPQGMWQDKYIYSKVVRKDVLKNNTPNSSYKAYYVPKSNSFVLDSEEAAIGTAPMQLENTYTYFSNGNLKEVKGRDGVVQTYLWGYNNQYPIAKITNRSISQVMSAMGGLTEQDLITFSSQIVPSSEYLAKINGLRSSFLSMSTYLYEPSVGIKKMIDSNGQFFTYDYDSLGRLIFIKDEQGNIVKGYKYAYRQ